MANCLADGCSNMATTRGGYCSQKCSARHRFMGKNNPRWNDGSIIVMCLECGDGFELTRPSKLEKGRGKFCSRECYAQNLKGRKLLPQQKRALEKGRGLFKGKRNPKVAGANNPRWKGDRVGYYALHSWVQRQLGKPDTCEFCGANGLSGKKIHWANIDHKYRRNLDDWIRLCAGCHLRYDGTNL